MAPIAKLSSISTTVPGEAQWDTSEGVLHIRTPHALTQAAGYLKYIYRSEGNVYFRGQTGLHKELRPSIFRVTGRWGAQHGAQEVLNVFMKKVEPMFLPDTPQYAYEPLLQHYGYRTRWLDIVDNVWVALWFACHDAHVTGKHGEYLHFMPRRDGNAYILLISPGREESIALEPGKFRTPEAEVIDLRRAAPSIYLRPHAQHGLLLRRRVVEKEHHVDLSAFVAGTLRVDVREALTWLGGTLLTVHNLFPPPRYDHGYRKMLDVRLAGDRRVGLVNVVGA